MEDCSICKENKKVCKYCNNLFNINDFRKNRLKYIYCERLDGKNYRKSNIGTKNQKNG